MDRPASFVRHFGSDRVHSGTIMDQPASFVRHFGTVLRPTKFFPKPPDLRLTRHSLRMGRLTLRADHRPQGERNSRRSACDGVGDEASRLRLRVEELEDPSCLSSS